jgi:hypothetical protein
MSYFRNFPLVNYNFGDEVQPNVFQNLSAYVDLIDQVAEDASFYQQYTIVDGERPDTLSYKLYDATEYYWTFYLLNDRIRQQGWPLTYQSLQSDSKKFYPNTTLTTDESLHGEFFAGDVVVTAPFSNPGFKGKIIEKRMDVGQLVVAPTLEVRSISITNGGSGYTSAPTITITGDGAGATASSQVSGGVLTQINITSGGDGYTFVPTITISPPNVDTGNSAAATATISTNGVSAGSVVYSAKGKPDNRLWSNDEARAMTVFQSLNQYDSVHHYEDSNGEFVDVPVHATPGMGARIRTPVGTPITFFNRLEAQNEELSRIKVFRPNVIEQVVLEFNRLLKN